MPSIVTVVNSLELRIKGRQDQPVKHGDSDEFSKEPVLLATTFISVFRIIWLRIYVFVNIVSGFENSLLDEAGRPPSRGQSLKDFCKVEGICKSI